MKKIFLGLLLVPSIAFAAETLPAGCFVADTNPTQCWQPAGVSFTVLFEDNFASMNSFYGFVIAKLAGERHDAYGLADECAATLNSNAAAYAQCMTERNNCGANYSTLWAAGQKNLKLIKKLRKACGTKCKKIK